MREIRREGRRSVTPEAAEHLDKAREALTKARGLLDVMPLQR